jgi:hypothetical protein
MRVTDQNYLHDEDESKLNLENASYSSVQDMLSSRPLFEKLKIKISAISFLLMFHAGGEFGISH